ncbi:hypothetical protein HNY42_09005 [Exiguobacterium sp. Helios]|uniref:hypothetical protein n=1 Tax=Exiguobacterium sp. Helios TaxID=2735868 RepID=UPI00165E098C|nr:hypothetical protein [Exiguobacterium sp. Helios]QNR21066.1 hypothetical protein HNY42_09005 [Exiguobacterium sp. Helios]
MNSEIITYFFIFLLGVSFFLPACYLLVLHFDNKQHSFFKKLKWTGILLIGLLCLWMTMPSFTEMVFRDYRVLEGACVLEPSESKRTSIDITLTETNDTFSFRDAPDLEAYGKKVPYYCRMTTTRNQAFEINYRVYEKDTKKLLYAN